MRLRLLCVGDVVGAPGRRILRDALPGLVERHGIHCVIVNAENAAGGSGLTPTIYEKLLRYGVHLVTLGDHVYRRRDIIPVLERAENIVRPANLSRTAPGRTLAVHPAAGGHPVAVFSLLGRMFMKPPGDSPFHAADAMLASVPKEVRVVVVDMHAEATSEKVAMGWHLDGRVSVLFGTHTHIPTADERILPGGTAYITDVGMTGPYDSVLGRDKSRVLRAMMNHVPHPLDVARDDVRLCGIMVDVDAHTGRAVCIERVCVREADLDGPAASEAEEPPA